VNGLDRRTIGLRLIDGDCRIVHEHSVASTINYVTDDGVLQSLGANDPNHYRL
jgi:hypothetical protein